MNEKVFLFRLQSKPHQQQQQNCLLLSSVSLKTASKKKKPSMFAKKGRKAPRTGLQKASDRSCWVVMICPVATLAVIVIADISHIIRGIWLLNLPLTWWIWDYSAEIFMAVTYVTISYYPYMAISCWALSAGRYLPPTPNPNSKLEFDLRFSKILNSHGIYLSGSSIPLGSYLCSINVSWKLTNI